MVPTSTCWEPLRATDVKFASNFVTEKVSFPQPRKWVPFFMLRCFGAGKASHSPASSLSSEQGVSAVEGCPELTVWGLLSQDHDPGDDSSFRMMPLANGGERC